MIVGSIVNVLQKKSTGGSSGPTYVTALGEELYLIIGESNAGDTTAAVGVGVTTPDGVCGKFNVAGNGWDYLTTGDMNKAGPTYGTGYKRFALNRYNRNGMKSLFVNEAAGGSEFIPNGDNNNWSNTGTLYATMKTRANNALTLKNVNRFRAVRITLGSNDIRNGALTLPDIYAGMVSLVERINADFFTPKICMTICNFYDGATSSMDARKWGMLKNYFDLAAAYPNVELVGNMFNMWTWGYGFGDQLHLTTPGYEIMEAQFERNVSSSETELEVRRMQVNLKNDPTTLQKAGIKSFYDKGYFTYLDGLQTFVGGSTDRDQLLYDWVGYTCPLDTNFDVVDNNLIHTDATPKYVSSNFIPSIGARKTSATNFIEGVRTGVNNVAAGTAGIPFGNNSGVLIRVFQTTSSNVFWSANITTNTTYTGWTKIPDNTEVAVGRNGGTQYLFGNGTILQQVNNTAGSAASGFSRIGGNGSAGFYMDCQFKHWYRIAHVGVNYAQFLTDLAEFEAIMATP
jgi:hypothetical protein